MKKMIVKPIASICLVFSMSSVFAMQPNDLVRQYMMDLGAANYKDITSLFTKNGYVVSTSQGRMDAKTFFYSFLPATVRTELTPKEVYKSELGDRMMARFHFTFEMKNGEKGEGEYVDEFRFNSTRDKLTAVYMFENLKVKE